MATEMATLGGGCFWCVEAAYLGLRGVKSAVSGYAGGAVENPGYRQVCAGTTGHAEVVQMTFDPDVDRQPGPCSKSSLPSMIQRP